QIAAFPNEILKHVDIISPTILVSKISDGIGWDTMLKEMNDAITYIEDHLAGELDLDEEIPRITGISLFQFKKTFLLLSDMPLLEYIRKRKMTLAAYDLRERNMKVIDVA